MSGTSGKGLDLEAETQTTFWKYYVQSNYRLVQQNISVFATIGIAYHLSFYLISRLWLDYWDSFITRVVAIAIFLILLGFYRTRELTLGHKWILEGMWLYLFPIWFSLHMFMNGADAFWGSSLLFAGAVYGLFANPPKALVFFPLSIFMVFSVLLWGLHYPLETLLPGILLALPAYLASIGMGVQTGIRRMVRAGERKNLIIQNQKQNLERVKIAKSEFLASMSHEIRTPMNAILGFSQILLHQSETNPKCTEHQKYLEYIKTSGEYLLMLINNILDISKIEAGKMSLLMEDIELRKMLDNIQNIFSGEAKGKGVKLELDIASDLPTYIHSDRMKLFQMVMNLVSNAIKFTEHGVVSISAHLVSPKLLIIVNDDGIGISPDRQRAIFDVADTMTTKDYGGSGLGLSITKKMVQLLNGTIGVESTLGKGSTFFIQIPYIQAKHLDKSPGVDQSERHLNNDRSVLVIEDNEVNRIMMSALFEGLKIPIDMANNGKEGLEKLLLLQTENLLPPLVIMDIHMPVMDGIEAVKQMRLIEGLADLPIVALSADAFKEQQAKALQAGFTDYLTKPIDMEKLLTIVHTYLGRSESYEQSSSAASDIFDFSRISDLDTHTQIHLVKLFRQQVQESIQELAALIEQNDHEGIEKKAHYIKGTALNLGAVYMADICSTLQAMSHEASADLLEDQHRKLIEAYEQVCPVMSACVDEHRQVAEDEVASVTD